jgi:hypothetical protein
MFCKGGLFLNKMGDYQFFETFLFLGNYDSYLFTHNRHVIDILGFSVNTTIIQQTANYTNCLYCFYFVYMFDPSGPSSGSYNK